MSAIGFDTLKFSNRLKAAGVLPAQAEAQAFALSEVLDVNLGELATKADLAAIRSEMATKAELAAIRIEMATKADFAALRGDMATKAELAVLRSEMATKAELAALRDDMATKAELAVLRSEMATKADLAAIRIEMATKAELMASKAELALFRAEMLEVTTSLRKDLEAIEYRLTIKLGVFLVSSAALFVALQKMF